MNFKNRILSRIFNLPANTSIIILNGGIGNQLFQYYLGEELRNIYKKNVIFYDIRKSYNINHDSFIEKTFNLNITKYSIKEQNFFVKHILLAPYALKILKYLYTFLRIKIFNNLYFDLSHNLEKSFLKYGLNIYFGTWHGLINKYFFLKKDLNLNFKKEITDKNLNLNDDFIAVHVRRGDYISSKKTSQHHGNLKKSYFIEAVNLLRNRYGNLRVILFSDDPKWLKSDLKDLIPNSLIFSSQSKSTDLDFFYMTNARFFVISNSTFSWWAAFLSKKKNKFIIIPKFWFNNVETNNDLIFKDWDYEIL